MIWGYPYFRKPPYCPHFWKVKQIQHHFFDWHTKVDHRKGTQRSSILTEDPILTDCFGYMLMSLQHVSPSSNVTYMVMTMLNVPWWFNQSQKPRHHRSSQDGVSKITDSLHAQGTVSECLDLEGKYFLGSQESESTGLRDLRICHCIMFV